MISFRFVFHLSHFARVYVYIIPKIIHFNTYGVCFFLVYTMPRCTIALNFFFLRFACCYYSINALRIHSLSQPFCRYWLYSCHKKLCVHFIPRWSFFICLYGVCVRVTVGSHRAADTWQFFLTRLCIRFLHGVGFFFSIRTNRKWYFFHRW